MKKINNPRQKLMDDMGKRIYHEISVAFGMKLDAQEEMKALEESL